jgi:hypothetical protein
MTYHVLEAALALGDPLFGIEDQDLDWAMLDGEPIDPAGPIPIIDKQEITQPFELRHLHKGPHLLCSPQLREALGEPDSGCEWHPASITVSGRSVDSHSLLYCRSVVPAIDRTASTVTWSKIDPELSDRIETLVLDQQVLSQLAEQRIRVFRLAESPFTYLVDASLKLDPAAFGQQFKLYPLAEWHSNVGFDDPALLLP